MIVPPPARLRWVGIAWWIGLIAFVVLARVRGWIEPADVMRTIEAAREHPWATAPIVWSVFVIGGLSFIPSTLMVGVCGALFGPWRGWAYGLSGAMLGATLFHLMGQRFGRGIVDAFASPRVQARITAIARRGVLAVAAIRLLPVAPHVVVGVCTGAARISLRDYTIGTLLVTAPLSLGLSWFGSELVSVSREPGTMPWFIAATVGMIALGLVLLRRVVRQSSLGAAAASDGVEAAQSRHG